MKTKELNYYEYEEVVKSFWKANIKQDYSNFSFIKAFESFEGLIYSKVSEHGFLTFKDFQNWEDELGLYDSDNLEQFAQETDYIQITKQELMEVIQKYKYGRMKAKFTTGNYSNLEDLKECYEEIQKAKNDELNQKEMVLLFDKIIHTEHETGLIFEDYFSLKELREEFEEELKGGNKE